MLAFTTCLGYKIKLFCTFCPGELGVHNVQQNDILPVLAVTGLSSPAITGLGSVSSLGGDLVTLGIFIIVVGGARLMVFKSGLSMLMANNIDPSPNKT